MSHWTGLILSQIRRSVEARMGLEGVAPIRIDNLQQNAMDGVHQARVRMEGDPNTYRLILAPVEAEIVVGGRPVADLFPKPLGVE